ncbi:unnamed protein product [Nippostrongylus brasiliensis]|uniref:SGNH domain-containing protein n=1 Tax=Nippostrongylus brasiliensis TaxID=27835 RepID=A0A158QYK7_NIPBR|nr:unnamed protein product [Nippostrongylus brasiliensis]
MYILIILLTLWSCLTIFPESNLDLNGKSVVPALMFLSNLWKSAGVFVDYFAELHVAENLFAHTWSLAVEMQFYLVVPILHLFLREHSTRTQNTCLLIVGHLAYISASTSTKYAKYAPVKTEENTDEGEHEEQQHLTDGTCHEKQQNLSEMLYVFVLLVASLFPRHLDELYTSPVRPNIQSIYRNKNPEMPNDMNESASVSALIIGNSWAANHARIIHKGCRNQLKSMTLFSYAACEVLVQTHTYHSCSSAHGRYDEIIQKIRPDYLFVIARHLELLPNLNQTSQTTDIYSLCLDKQVFARIQRIQKPVKKKVFILDALPRTVQGYLKTLNSKLVKHQPVNQTEFIEPTKLEFARSILRRAVKLCQKCSLISYDSIFGAGKSFQVFDPQSKVAYFTNGNHLTAAGLWKIAPVYERLCGSF